MKKHSVKLTILLAGMICLSTPAWAQMSHGNHGSHNMGTDMSHTGHQGRLIHESAQKGFQLAYHLIDMAEQMKNMQGMKMDMPHEVGTHHLMVYVKSADGGPVEKAKVGYLIKGPDGAEQKAMAMGMTGGYGADVNFKTKGKYDIKTKIVSQGTTLVDDFTFTVK